MSNYEKPSLWCARKRDEAIERGDIESAMHYNEMYSLWVKRGQ